MQDFVANHWSRIWNRYLGKNSHLNGLNQDNLDNKVSHNELHDLIKGTKLHCRISSRNIIDEISINSDSEEENDPDYYPIDEISENSDIESDAELHMNEISTHNISNVITLSTGCSCIKNILDELKKI